VNAVDELHPSTHCTLCDISHIVADKSAKPRDDALKCTEESDGIVRAREKQIRGSGGSLEPPGPLPMHLHTVCVAYSECLPILLNPLAQRTCFSQVPADCQACFAPDNKAAVCHSHTCQDAAAGGHCPGPPAAFACPSRFQP
jgi:hypothetical protein